MPSKVPCYLYALRKTWGLSQDELAALVPRCRRTRVSDVERNISKPNVRELLAYALIFGRRPEEIFPSYAESIEDAVIRAAAEFDRKLAKEDSSKATRKQELLESMGRRLSPEPNLDVL